MLLFNTTVDGIQLGLCYAVLALGMYIAYSVLDFPDLTADGSFPLGGVVGTIFIYRLHFNPVLALLGGFLAGMLAGMVTGILHVKFNINKLLSSIIVMTALLSVTLALTKVLTQTGVTTTNFSYIVNGINGIFNDGHTIKGDLFTTVVLFIIAIAAKILLDLFFSTKAGFMLIATGNNGHLVTSLGKNCGFYKIIGLMIANGLIAFSGAVYAQITINYDNTCGSGKVVLALASVIIGLVVFSKARRVKPTTAVMVGALIYSLALNYFTLIDTDGTYLKIMNAVCFAIILIINSGISGKRHKKLSSKISESEVSRL